MIVLQQSSENCLLQKFLRERDVLVRYHEYFNSQWSCVNRYSRDCAQFSGADT